ncbi:hypothetical protein BDB01DRAFT_510078 [Pilobolus umbonatus]|nr:hypothetical protein BDB01DRAFT_510078 [Pilobolus umbonatus]
MTEEPQPIEPKQLKYLMNKKDINKQHIFYDYYKQECFEAGIDEFLSYAEVKNDMPLYEIQYRKSFKLWTESTHIERKEYIQQALDDFEVVNDEQRHSAAQIMAYIALGNYGEFMGDHHQEHIQNIHYNNKLLYDMGIISILKESLSRTSYQIESLSSQLLDKVCMEIELLLTILYTVVDHNRLHNDGFTIAEYQLSEFLFDMLVRLREHLTKPFLLKKLVLCLHKVLIATLENTGSSRDHLKVEIRKALQLPIIKNKNAQVKASPEDIMSFYHTIQERYPTYTPIPLPKTISNPITVTASHKLSTAMGVSKASKEIDLPYQTLFPSKNQQAPVSRSNNSSRSMNGDIHSTLSETSMNAPYSLTVANSVWLEHLYISVGDYQLIKEREKAIHRWELLDKAIKRDEENLLLEEEDRQKMEVIDHLYSTIAPNFQSIVVVALKLLLSTVSIGKDKEAEILEDINITRNRETISKAVSSIILLLLKWFKLSHVLKFEYLSQILVDSGCMLLILKLLGLQEVALLACKKSDDDTQSFFGYVQHYEEEEGEDDKPYTNQRNLCWPINLLRILQMLTKGKTHRIMLLVQYKSSAILKKLLKVGHPVIDLYVLKNLRNQIYFMGRKWRASNMKTISAIYSNCMTKLDDNWLSSAEGSIDIEEAAMKEVNLRILTRLYNGQWYVPSIMPTMDDINGPDSILFHDRKSFSLTSDDINHYRLPDYSITSPFMINDIQLDSHFKEHYNEWLESEVYSSNEEDEEDEEDESTADHEWNAATPIPNIPHSPLSQEQLTYEINKLYMEELQREFEEQKKKEQKKVQVPEDGWDVPINTEKANVWKDEEEEEIDKEVDPLNIIDWGELTEEDLNRRLKIVEEKASKRWLNVPMDDARYLKVLNTFEDEEIIPIDEEGWPIG